MRGKDAFISPYGDIPGITPAHAGKRIGFSAFSGLSGDHPRTCGEKSLMRSLHTGRLGSPPHMRGKVGHCLASNSILGITPAHAGKSILFLVESMDFWDHPRTCGEKDHTYQQGLERMGSPPHMRGKGMQITGRATKTGITPAHAGKRYARIGSAFTFRDHPRTCGEKKRVKASICNDEGSPPHMRGKAECLTCCRFAHGITPAHAGKSADGLS